MAATKKQTPKKLTSWSFSRYADYKQCPLKTKFKHIDKIAEPPNKAMARGAEIHKLAEDYVKGKIARLPVDLKLFKDEFARLKKLYKKDPDKIVVEDTWAFTDDWIETAWNNWTGCWVRIKLDLAHQQSESNVLYVRDWKTGKFDPANQEDYLEQLELYALGAFLMYDNIQEVRPSLGYLDHGNTHPLPDSPIIFKRSDLEKLKKIWNKRVKAMMSDVIFAPRPNDKCKWCFYRKSNAANGGGQCKF